jgi:hypothetical protein
MGNGTAAASIRIPKRHTASLRASEAGSFQAETGTLPKETRDRLVKSILELKGALKGKVKPPNMPMGAWRKQMWQRALRKANGDKWKAIGIIKKDEEAVLRKMGLEHLLLEVRK